MRNDDSERENVGKMSQGLVRNTSTGRKRPQKMARLGNADEGRNFGQLKDVRELVEQAEE